MSFVITTPEMLNAAATDLARIGSTIGAANMTAAAPTTTIVAAAADEVSSAIAEVLGAHGQLYQAVSAQAATFHDEFVQMLNAGGNAYAHAEVASAAAMANPLDT